MEGFDVGDAISAASVIVAVVFSFLTVRSSRAASREEGERFERELRIEREQRRIDHTRRWHEDAERRLERVLGRVVEIDEITVAAYEHGSDSTNRIGLAKRRLRAALSGIAQDLPQTAWCSETRFAV
jgi:hypothetical protein